MKEWKKQPTLHIITTIPVPIYAETGVALHQYVGAATI